MAPGRHGPSDDPLCIGYLLARIFFDTQVMGRSALVRIQQTTARVKHPTGAMTSAGGDP
jgi:hypothetical protein